MAAEEESETIQAILSGNVDRYADLVDAYRDSALRLAFSLLGNYEDARDAAQEAFVSAYRALPRFRGRSQFSTWLYRIVINKCKDTFRRRQRVPAMLSLQPADPTQDGFGLFIEVEDTAQHPSRTLGSRELSRRLSDAIGQLPDKRRTAFILHHLHGMNLEESAAIMGCRVGTVKAHVARATEQLRAALSPLVHEEDVR